MHSELTTGPIFPKSLFGGNQDLPQAANEAIGEYGGVRRKSGIRTDVIPPRGPWGANPLRTKGIPIWQKPRKGTGLIQKYYG